MYIRVFFFKQKTAYEMRISDWSSDVCSSDLDGHRSGDRQIEPDCERERADSEQLDGDHHEHAEQNQAPWKALVQEAADDGGHRSEERRVGNECGSTCRFRGSEVHVNKHRLVVELNRV